MLRLFTFTLLFVCNIATAGTAYQSNYAGQENREIKSLSQDEIAGLKAGKGLGLAKAAELNGVPGPRHLLDMKVEIGLSDEQIEDIQSLFHKMKTKAIELGHLLILSERRLNNAFYYRHMNKIRLNKMLEVNEMIRKELRYVHLVAHLETLDTVTDEQISLYNQLRGYISSEEAESTDNSSYNNNRHDHK